MLPDDNELLCATEVCRLLKISRRTFFRLREQGKLPQPTVQWNKVGSRWRRGDILAMSEQMLPRDKMEAVIASAHRHIKAAASSATSAAHHAAAAGNALRFFANHHVHTREIDEAAAQRPASDQETKQAQDHTQTD